MNFKRTNSTLTNLERGEDITLYDVIGLFQDICEDLEEENDTTLDELRVGDTEKLVGRLLWIGQEITSVLRSNKKILIDPDRAMKIKKQEDKLASEISALEYSELELQQYTEKEKELIKVQEKRQITDQQKKKLIEICKSMEAENDESVSFTIPQLQEKIAQLERKRSELNHSCAVCESETTELRHSNTVLQNRLKEAQEQYDELKRQTDIASSKLQSAELSSKNLKSNLAELQTRLTLLEEECGQLKEDTHRYQTISIPETEAKKLELQKSKTELEDKYSLCKEKESELDSLNKDLLAHMEKSESKCKDLTALHETMSAKFKKYESQKVEYQKKIIELKAVIDTLEKECHRLEYDSIQYESVTIPELEAVKVRQLKRKNDLKLNCEEKQKEEKSLCSSIENLQNILEETTKQCEQLKSDIIIEQEKIKNLEEMKKEKQTDVDLLRAQLNQQNSQLGTLETEKNNLIRRINDLRVNIDEHNIHNLRKRFKEHEEEYQNLQKEHQILEKELEELMKQKGDVVLKETKLGNDILDVKNIISDKEQKISKLSADKLDINASLEEKTKQLTELNEWFRGLECKDCTERISRLQNRINVLKDVQKALIKDLDEKLYLSEDSAIEQMRKISDDIASTLTEYEDGIKELQSRYATIVKMIYDKGDY